MLYLVLALILLVGVAGHPEGQLATIENAETHCHYKDVHQDKTIDVPVGYSVEGTCGKCVCDKEKGLVCKICLGCSYHSTSYQHGDTWWQDCNKCNCLNSTIRCESRSCPDICEYGDRKYGTGETWWKDCNMCTCAKGGIHDCGNPKICSCSYDGPAVDTTVTRIHNEEWRSEGGDLCFCLAGTVVGPRTCSGGDEDDGSTIYDFFGF